ncbi:putative DNA repair protein RAD23 [Tetrabaena socialis]|uniref:Ubiquitin receptor RAD23 n=1 Tax=Tetrabaena socialis TaxID=47790 RepID=A0A2J7ZYK8_9CHLO|nr:putative DNA repair protein RAD23 [Tetrabaena socialis]|eukprot:PNH05354.1 putative DNA repair protein RAD23 [Tetrabaena socialis]
MKLTFRTIVGKSFNIEAEESLTISALKDKVTETQPECVRDAMKLVYKGKVLDDATTVGDNQITESSFVVVFVQPKKAEAAKPAAAPSSVPTEAAPVAISSAPAAEAPPVVSSAAGAAPAAASHPAAAPAAVAASAATAAVNPADAYTTAASGLLAGNALESAVSNIMEMGFPHDEVVRAMRAAFNNPDRAVEYLMSGIPASAGPPPPAAAPQHGNPSAAQAAQRAADVGPNAQPFNMFGGPAPGAAAAGEGEGNPALAALRGNPAVGMLRAAVAQDPRSLVPLLQQLGRSNPELVQAINQNQQEFLRMLTQPAEGEHEDAMAALLGGADGEGEGGMVVELSEEDEAAIARLAALGFERNACLEAYLACDKDEEVAANFLAENMFD